MHLDSHSFIFSSYPSHLKHSIPPDPITLFSSFLILSSPFLFHPTRLIIYRLYHLFLESHPPLFPFLIPQTTKIKLSPFYLSESEESFLYSHAPLIQCQVISKYFVFLSTWQTHPPIPKLTTSYTNIFRSVVSSNIHPELAKRSDSKTCLSWVNSLHIHTAKFDDR